MKNLVMMMALAGVLAACQVPATSGSGTEGVGEPLPVIAGVPKGYSRIFGEVPEPVLAATPPAVSARDIYTKDGCYYYVAGGQMAPVVPLGSLKAGGKAGPICQQKAA